MAPATRTAQSTDLSPEEFWQRVRDTRATLDALAAEEPAARAAQLAELAQEWDAVRAVRLPDGRRAPLATTRLVTLLRHEAPDIDRLQVELEALQAAANSWPERPSAPADASERLARILARPEYQWDAAEAPNYFNRALNYLYFRLLRFIYEVNRLVPPGVRILLGGAAFLIVLFFGLRGIWQSLAGEAVLATDSHLDEPISAAAALQRARQFSERGDYRTAVRYLYLSTLLELEERGLLIYDRSRTNREYLRSVAHQPELAATLRDVVDVFDRVWYGFQPLAEEAYMRYQSQVEALRRRRGPL